MKVIIGLGNPESQYINTPHNVGFAALDFFARESNASFSHEKKLKADTCDLEHDGMPVLLVKPTTYMNRSGESIASVVAFYKLNPETDILIVHDEIDLPFGTFRLSKNASSAGHKGVQNIIDQLSTQAFTRLRIGVDARAPESKIPTEAYVLESMDSKRQEILNHDVLPAVVIEIKKFLES